MGSGLHPLDRVIAWVSPERALRRAGARRALAHYEAAKPSTQRSAKRSRGGPDHSVIRAGHSLREQARHLDENHDLARGILNVLVQNTVGPNGIGVEPQPRRADGSIHEDLAREILQLRRDWARRPEVTWEHDLAASERMVARSLYRDGEALAQILVGNVRGLDHGTRVPFSLELLESDLLPMEHHSLHQGIVAGVERNDWGRPRRYHLYREHPSDHRLISRTHELKQVPAERMLHLKLTDRIRQVRGVSIFASVLMRLDDIKDYEESERIAAKVAASMAAYIKKGSPDTYDTGTAPGEKREMKFRPGLVFDDLVQGEEIGTIDTTRPTSQLENHRRGQIRAAASGTNVTYSSAAKDYDGTYSAQRQELVEGYGAYGVLTNLIVGQFSRPVHERLVAAAVASGRLRIPADVDPTTIDDALFIGPQMPWIDPDRESRGWERMERNVHASGPEIIRRRGQNPHDVLEQERWWRKKLRENDIRTEADPDAGADGDDDDEGQGEGQLARTRGVRRRA